MNWAFVKSTLAYRRHERRALANGYLPADPTECGFTLFDRIRQRGDRIVDVSISPSGDMLYLKLEPRTRDSDGSGEAGQTAQQAGPKATARAAESGIAQGEHP